MSRDKLLLVGDNPFLGISHLSQERASSRGDTLTDPRFAARLVETSLENGADGFMFTVSENTLSILRIITNDQAHGQPQLYAMVPYAYEFVRLAVLSGGVRGLATKVAVQIVSSGNVRAILLGLRGAITNNPASLLESYLLYEIFRLRSAAGSKAALTSILLHEVLTDMALALDMDWLFKTHIDFMSRSGIKPGFETRNFSFLVNKLHGWGINARNVVIAAPFNAVGFQMCPSKDECEEALARIPEAEVIAFSILAAGYLGLREATEYLANLPSIRGVAVGVSKERHARETFEFMRQKL